MKYRHLTQAQRFIIEDLLRLGEKPPAIAKHLGVHRSTIWREVKRNRSARGYFGLGAQRSARSRKRCFLEYPRKLKGELERVVVECLQKAWSPEQITNRLRLEGKLNVSHETIYRYLQFDRSRGGKLFFYLRRFRKRRKRFAARRSGWDGSERLNISKRSHSANRREELGHWERDLICGRQGEASLLVLIDRRSRLVKVERVQSRSAAEVNEKTLHALAGQRVLSITNDNGLEFARFRELEEKFEAKVYFSDPYASWQRGSVENANGLLRQFFPKRTSFKDVVEWKLQKAAELLNNRPRKTLGWRTPMESHSGQHQKMFRKKIGNEDD